MTENDRKIYSERTALQHFFIRMAVGILLLIVVAAIFENYASATATPSKGAIQVTLSSHQSASPTTAALSVWAGKNGAIDNAQLNAAALIEAKYVAQHPTARTVPTIKVAFAHWSSCWAGGPDIALLSSQCPVPVGSEAYFGVAEVSGSTGVTAVVFFGEDPSNPALRTR